MTDEFELVSVLIHGILEFTLCLHYAQPCTCFLVVSKPFPLCASYVGSYLMRGGGRPLFISDPNIQES